MWRKAKITLKIYKYVCLRSLPLMFLMQLACVQAGSSPSCCGGGGRALMKRCTRFDLAFLLLFKLKKKMKGKKLLKKSQVESQAESMLSPNVERHLHGNTTAPVISLLHLRSTDDQSRHTTVDMLVSPSALPRAPRGSTLTARQDNIPSWLTPLLRFHCWNSAAGILLRCCRLGLAPCMWTRSRALLYMHGSRSPELRAGQTPPAFSPRHKHFLDQEERPAGDTFLLSASVTSTDSKGGAWSVCVGVWVGLGSCCVFECWRRRGPGWKARMNVRDLFVPEREEHLSVCSSFQGCARGEPCTHTNAASEETRSVIHSFCVRMAL